MDVIDDDADDDDDDEDDDEDDDKDDEDDDDEDDDGCGTLSQQGLLATCLIPGCVGRRRRRCLEIWAPGNLEIWRSVDLEIHKFGVQTTKEKYQNPNPFCPKCRQGLY